MNRANSSIRPQWLQDSLLRMMQERLYVGLCLEDQLAFFCKTVSTEINVPRVGIWLLSENGKALTSRLEWDANHDSLSSGSILLEEDADTYILAFKTELIISVEDASTDPRCTELAKRYLHETGVSALLHCPLYSGDGLTGVVCVEQTGAPRIWTDAERDYIVAITSLISLAIETDARHTAEKTGRQRIQRLNSFSEMAADFLWVTNADLELTALPEITVKQQPEIQGFIGKQPWDVEGATPIDMTWTEFREMMESRQIYKDIVFAYPVGDGQLKYTEASGRPEYDSEGDFAGYVGVSRDITDRIEREAKLRESEHRYRTASQIASLGHWVWDESNHRCGFCSPELAAIFNIDVDAFLQRSDSFEQYLDWVHPEDRDAYRGLVLGAINNKSGFETDFRIVRDNGEVRHLYEMAEVRLGQSDGVMIRTGVLQDVTRQKLTEEALILSQRREAIGQLTAGVAHDFNNMLAVIMGNLELHCLEFDDQDPPMVSTALEAASRGAELTKSLLAFSRKAPLDPEVVDLNSIVQRSKNWITRALPKTIEVQSTFSGELWKTEADVTSLDAVLLNLILNANDAMPSGGKITIRTSNEVIENDTINNGSDRVEPGRYVVLTISDTGQGIQPDKINKIFEPFFTTKGFVGGSGLGLSMVQGFMQQSGGTVLVSSEVGVGSTFKLYFKALSSEEERRISTHKKGAWQQMSGKILLAEDEPDVLHVITTILKTAGYDVVGAASGDEAKKIFEADPTFDLLITDVVMPGELFGPGLAHELRKIVPGLPVVFLSGYASEATVHANGLRPDDVRLMKPVSRSELITRIEGIVARTRDSINL